MKKLRSFFGFKLSFLFLTSLLIIACSDAADDDELSVGRDLNNFLNGNGIMMQAFYWDVEPRFDWWDNITAKMDDWSSHGVERIWLPPASKGQSGGFSMGYDPSDYYDLGEYNQHGTIETRFGSRAELDELISTAHTMNIEVIADIVMGHNSGGGIQNNPYRGKQTYTLFNQSNGNASGMFNRTYEDFHPNSIHNNDEEALFFEEQDLCHLQDNVQNWFWKKENSVAKYYKNEVGFDGWRFDYVKSFSPEYVKAWVNEVGGWAVGEFFDGNATLLRKWVAESGIKAFDFACLFRMRDAFEQNNLDILRNGDMLWKSNPDDAVTFVANHDTDREPVIATRHKLFAYAYILTHPGYPTIFYSDYENLNYKKKIQDLMLINRSIATGDLEVLYADSDEYIAIRKGQNDNPGLAIYINRSTIMLTREVKTHWTNQKLHDYSGNITSGLFTGLDGLVQLESPANSYTVWSIE